jgi:hypothetical protein
MYFKHFLIKLERISLATVEQNGLETEARERLQKLIESLE